MTTVDLNTRIVASDERAYILFPGEDHRFYNDFNTNGRVYLDFPGLDLTGVSILSSSKDWAPRLGMSETVRTWHRKRRPAASVPSRDVTAYKNYGVTANRALFAGAAGNLYFGAKKGELVVVPGKGYWTDVLIGEFVDDPGRLGSVDVNAIYPGERIPSRRVRWLARTPKGSLPPELVKRLQMPNPFTVVDRSFRDELYRLAYPNFAYDGTFTARIFTSEPEFTTVDDLTIQLFVNQIVGILAGEELGQSVTTVEGAINLLNQHPEFVPDLAMNINSPGNLTIYSQRIVPLVIAALMALALSGASAQTPVASLTVINSASPGAAECTAQVDESVKDILRIMGYQRWKETCEQLQATAERTGLAPQVSVTP